MVSWPIFFASLGCAMALKVTPVHEWKYFEYHWNNESEKEHATATGLYNSTNILLYDAEWHKDGKLFATTPRMHHVNPASLSTVSEEGLLHPYPSPEWHVVGNCSGITNALRIVIDKCDHMWIVDSGTIGNEVICPAQILKIDVKTDRLVMRHMIPEEVSKRGLLATSAVRTEGDKCEKIMVVCADLRGSGYVIFDGSTSWRLDKYIFEPDAKFTNYVVDDRIVNLSIGPIGFTVVENKFTFSEMGFMWPFSGNHVYGIPMQDLLDSRDSQENIKWYKSEYEFQNASSAGVISKQGVLFGAFVGPHKLMCVGLQNSLGLENIDVLIEHSELPLDITSMKTRPDANGDEYLMITASNYLQWIAGTIDFRKDNFGIYVANVIALTKGTRCEPTADFVPRKGWAESGFAPLENHNDSNL